MLILLMTTGGSKGEGEQRPPQSGVWPPLPQSGGDGTASAENSFFCFRPTFSVYCILVPHALVVVIYCRFYFFFYYVHFLNLLLFYCFYAAHGCNKFTITMMMF